MACRDAYEIITRQTIENIDVNQSTTSKEVNIAKDGRLLFGVDSKVASNDVLQNNLTLFEWVTRNKLYPNFWGRNITGKDRLTKEEIDFLHINGCKVAAIYNEPGLKETEQQGYIEAKKIAVTATELGIRVGSAIFLKIEENANVTTEYMMGYAKGLIFEGYTPGFMANTDAKYSFDFEFSRGMQSDEELFSKCIIWAVSPSLKEYERITTSHLIHPDNWAAHAPSGITRNDIAVWQYGKDCHPINDDAGVETTFNINLVRNEQVIIDKMF